MTAQTITPGTPEPKEYGSFLIATSTGIPLFISHHRESESAEVAWSDIEMDDCSWRTLVRDECGYTIESMVTRDARIRRDALTLSDDEVNELNGLLEKELETQNYIEAINADDWNLILSNIFAAVAKSRERES